jgi:hypothetical protein
MFKFICLLMLAATMSACVTSADLEAMTPEQRADYYDRLSRAGSAMTGLSQQLNSMQRQPTTTNCQTVDIGGGLYQTQCQ